MEYETIAVCIQEIERVLKYPNVIFNKHVDNHFYFTAIDAKQNYHELIYNSETKRYFKTIHGCATYLKEFQMLDSEVK